VRSFENRWGFATGTTNPWLRLNTFNTATNANPTIDLDQVVKFDIYSDKSLKVGVGVRETATTAAYGANGGTTGTIEWIGVPSATAVRLIQAACGCEYMDDSELQCSF